MPDLRTIGVDALVQALGQIVYDWRPGSGELHWGGDYARILGYAEHEMGATTESWTRRVHPEDLAPVLREVDDCTRERRFYDLEYRFCHRDGHYVWMHDRGVPFFLPDGRLDRIIGVFSDISERKRAEEDLRRSSARLRELTRRLVESEESERRKINRELHDRVGQGLSSLLLSLDLAQERLAYDTREAALQRLGEARALALKAVRDTRDVMADLRPPALDDFGLFAAVRAHAEQFAARTSLQVAVRGETVAGVAGIAETALFRIAQEALVNVAKHARATRVEVSVTGNEGRAELRISDNGGGFQAGSERAASWGLKTMRERAEAVGATLRVDSRPGEGTTISVSVPRARA